MRAGDTITDGTVVWTVRKSASSTELTNHNDNASAHANLLSGTSFGTAVVNHLLGTALASLVSAVSTDSLFSKLLKKALEAAGLQYSMGTNGYICFGALFGNLILQWGIQQADGGTFSFPIAFTTSRILIAVSQYEAGMHLIAEKTIQQSNLTGTALWCTDQSWTQQTNYNARWAAIGY